MLCRTIRSTGRADLWDRLVSYIIKGNVLRGGVYPLCAGPERVVQAMHVAQVARLLWRGGIAHGSTGAGNDQVRFDLAIRVLMPEAHHYRADTPAWRAKSRRGGLPGGARFHSAGKDGSTIRSTRACSARLSAAAKRSNSWDYPPDDAFMDTASPLRAPDSPALPAIGFDAGLPVSLDGVQLPPLELMGRARPRGRGARRRAGHPPGQHDTRA